MCNMHIEEFEKLISCQLALFVAKWREASGPNWPDKLPNLSDWMEHFELWLEQD